MMKKILIAAMCMLGIAAVANGQIATFTDINPDARSMGMGNAGYALGANAFSIFNNTASVAFENDMLSAGYSFNLYAPDADTFNNMHTVGAYYRIAKKHSVALGFNYLVYNEISGLLDPVNPSDPPRSVSYTPREMALALGYAYRINDIFSAAVNVRYINSDIFDSALDSRYKTGTAFAGDVSFMYRDNGLTASAGVYNIGSQIDYGTSKGDLSSHVKLGVGYEYGINDTHYITGTLQGSYLLTAELDDAQEIFAGIGAEYSYKKLYSVRAGYRAGDKSTSYATVGLGVAVGPVTFDASYLIGGEESILNNTVVLGLSVNF